MNQRNGVASEQKAHLFALPSPAPSVDPVADPFLTTVDPRPPETHKLISSRQGLVWRESLSERDMESSSGCLCVDDDADAAVGQEIRCYQ